MNKAEIIVLLIALAIVIASEMLCRIEIKCPYCTKVSDTIHSSMQSGFYRVRYEAMNPTINLLQHPYTVTFENAWAEQAWHINSNLCLLSKSQGIEGKYSIVLPFIKDYENDFAFSLTPIINGSECKTCGGIEYNRKVFTMTYLPDTLNVQVYERDSIKGIGWKNKIKGRIIKFVKRIE